MQLAIQVSLHIVDFGFHRGERLQNQIGVSLNQVFEIDISSVGRILHDQIHFLLKQIASVLESEFWVGVQNLLDIGGIDIMRVLQVGEHACQVVDFTSQNTV